MTTILDSPAAAPPGLRPAGEAMPSIQGLGRCLVTFEVGDQSLLWTALPLRRRARKNGIKRGMLAVGYSDPDRLAQWFEDFWSAAGSVKHEIHLLVSGPEILQRSFYVPVVPTKELGVVVASQAKSVFPFDISRGLLGWKVIDKTYSAGRAQYEIHAEALDRRWESWLNRWFGPRTEDITRMSAGSQRWEHLLRTVSGGPLKDVTFVVRLKGTVLETGFFREGQVEFFRESLVEIMAGDNSLAQPQRTAGIDDLPHEKSYHRQSERIGKEVRQLVDDAIDYYHGRYSLRRVETVYLCLPDYLVAPTKDHLAALTGAEVVNFADRLKAVRGKRQLHDEIEDDLPLWLTVAPCLKPLVRHTSLIPPDIVNRRRERQRFGYAVVALVTTCIALIVFTVIDNYQLSKAESLIAVQRQELSRLEGDPVLAQVNSERARADQLRRNLQPLGLGEDPGYVVAMKVLSAVARPDVYLESVRLVPTTPGGCRAEVSGTVTGPNDRQEPLLFTYLTCLEESPFVQDIRLVSKQQEVQFGRKTERFSFEMGVVP